VKSIVINGWAVLNKNKVLRPYQEKNSRKLGVCFLRIISLVPAKNTCGNNLIGKNRKPISTAIKSFLIYLSQLLRAPQVI